MAKKIKEQNLHTCKDCKFATDFHEKNHKGEFFLCKCKFFHYSKFLNRDCCDKFEKKL